MPEPKRIFLRLDDCLSCNFKYEHFQKERVGQGTILDISGGGLKMISKDILKVNSKITIEIDPPLGPLAAKGEVLSSKLEYYVTDKQKDMFWTTRIQFSNLAIADRKKIIDYVYRCHIERRKALHRKKT